MENATLSLYAVMTIDRMLPGVDGLSIIRKLRESGIDIPALIVRSMIVCADYGVAATTTW